MKKALAVLLALCMVLALCACGAEDSSAAQAGTAETASAQAADPAEQQSEAPSETSEAPAATTTILMSDIPGEPEGDLGSYHIKLTGCDYCSDDNGNTAIVITFEFTNNSTESVVPREAITCQAFQDGMSISMATISDSPIYDSGAAMGLSVEPGTMTVCQCAFTQASDAPIEFDVTEIAAVDGAKVYGSFDAAV